IRKEGSAVTELGLRSRRSAATLSVELHSRVLDGPGLSLMSLVDVSARKRAEAERRQLQEAERAALEASHAKDQVIASLSHELRTPLAPVLAVIPKLRQGHAGNSSEQRLLEIVRRNVLLEARLIDDLLDATRIAFGKLSIDREIVDLHAVVRDAIEMFAED